MKKAVAYARARKGPALVHAHVIRPYSHSLSDDEVLYKPKEEREAEAARDPIVTFPKWLVAEGHATDADIAAIVESVDAEVQAATDDALEPRPLQRGSPLRIRTATPRRQPRSARSFTIGAVAAFRRGSRGSRPPSPAISVIATPRPGAKAHSTSSPGASRAKPSTSNPAQTLATVAGAKAATFPRPSPLAPRPCFLGASAFLMRVSRDAEEVGEDPGRRDLARRPGRGSRAGVRSSGRCGNRGCCARARA
jgi:hypothetical protein